MKTIAAMMVATGTFGLLVQSSIAQGQDQAPLGFWIVDLTNEQNKKNGPNYLPLPFHFDGKGVTHWYEAFREPHESTFRRLRSEWRGENLYYLHYTPNKERRHEWIKLASFDGARFIVEHNGKKWIYARRKKQEVAPRFQGYFESHPLHAYSEPEKRE